MAKRYDKEKYENLAYKKGLEFVDRVPPLVTVAVNWKCLKCGTVQTKSFRAVSNTARGCLCQGDLTLSDEKYLAIAKRWSLTWEPGKYKPKNVKLQTTWRLPNNNVLIASYYELAYEGKMPNRVKAALGLPHRRRGGATNV